MGWGPWGPEQESIATLWPLGSSREYNWLMIKSINGDGKQEADFQTTSVLIGINESGKQRSLAGNNGVGASEE